ncbi:MAG TPA: twin-arginine translocase TatA/TatE family subunit [Blastocatellia bacterium]|jgi:sec-independent protein translocase protein TatA
MNFGPTELVIILLIVLLLFGARRIPDLAKGLGEGIRNFKSGMKGDERPELEERDRIRDDRRYREESDRREESRGSV